MKKPQQGDLIINGTGNAGGGSYREVKINGEGIVHGDVECQHMKTNGRAEFDGHFKSDTAVVRGTADIRGRAFFKKLRIDGSLSVSESYAGEEVKVRGDLVVRGDCAAERFHAFGAFHVDGLLNADEIEVRLHGKSEAREIGGGRIHVQQGMISALLSKFLKHGELVAELIEGDDIHLEYTKANVVRGNNVTIGPGCEIGLVEYRSQFQQNKSSNVLSSKQA